MNRTGHAMGWSRRFWRLFSSDERGAAAVEYAILMGLIAVGLIVAVSALRSGIMQVFTETEQGLAQGAGE